MKKWITKMELHVEAETRVEAMRALDHFVKYADEYILDRANHDLTVQYPPKEEAS